jgi:hypothetical protein
MLVAGKPISGVWIEADGAPPDLNKKIANHVVKGCMHRTCYWLRKRSPVSSTFLSDYERNAHLQAPHFEFLTRIT